MSTPFSTAVARFQQIDAASRGAPVPGIRSIAFRRDAGTPLGARRVVALEVVMAEGDYATFGESFGANYAGAPTTVVAQRMIGLPDWSVPAGSPAPFDLVVPFDAPWTYTGAGDLLFELRVHSNSETVRPFYTDRAATQYRIASGTQNGTGCAAGPQRSEMRLSSFARTSATTIELGFELRSAPAGAPIVLALGTSDPMFALPGLCAALRTDAALTLSLAVADAVGSVAPRVFLLPWDPQLAGATLFAQSAASDPSQPALPVVVSSGNRTTVPGAQGGPLVLAKTAANTTAALAPTAAGVLSGGIVARFEH
jgi:hypothetical protein